MQWTAEQEQVLAHSTGRCQVLGGPATGRTSVLVERWRRRAAAGRPDRLLVVCRSRGAAEQFGESALAGGSWAGDTLPITTFFGVAFDLLRRLGRAPRLLGRSQQWSLVRRLLAGEDARSWPGCAGLLGRAAFVDQVAAAVLAVEMAGVADEEVLAVAGRWGQGERWADLLAFRHRYRRATRSRGVVDEAQLFREAMAALADDQAPEAEARRWDEVLIDDADAATAAMGSLAESLAVPAMVAVGQDAAPLPPGGWPGWRDGAGWEQVVRFGRCLRTMPPPTVEVCRHPSSEPEAIAAGLVAAHQAGVEWRQMAVLVPRPGPRTEAVGRALARHAIPARLGSGAPRAEPAVRAVLDFFAWSAGDASAFDRLLVSPAVDLAPGELRRLRRAAFDEGVSLDEHPRLAALAALKEEMAPRLSSEDPAGLAHEVWVRLLGRLVPDPGDERPDALEGRAWAALGAYLAALSERAAQDPTWRIGDELALAAGPDFDPDPWLPAAKTGDGDAVTLGTIGSAAGRCWDTVVVCGCLEGELPRLPSATRFFDDAVLDAVLDADAALAGGPPELAQRRQWALARERRRFALASSRARSRLVLTAAPAPGQVVSRFVADVAPAVTAGAALSPGPPGPVVRPTDSTRWPRSTFTPYPETDGVAPVYPDRRLDLSASRLTTYDDCPLRYFYGYTLGVRGTGGVAASMGTMVHAALAAFLDPVRTRPSADTPADYSWPALEALAGSLWDQEWSETIAPYQPMREQARRDVFAMLRSWWDAEAALAAGGSWPLVVAVEHPFVIDVGGHRVRGYIDRVDRVEGGLAIIDYKTGAKVPRQEDVALDLQLATYHLAALRDPVLAGEGAPVSLQLWYLRSGVTVSQPITDDHELRTEARIVDIAERILAEAFEPSVEADCDYCEFKRLCPLKDEGRQLVGE